MKDPSGIVRTWVHTKLKNAISGSTLYYTDWFHPSRDELALMYSNLKYQGVGNFNYSLYWSSSESSASEAWYINFLTGAQVNVGAKTAPLKIRACRSFTDSVGAYSLKDIGPAGGLIFYVSGSTYYEASPTDIGPGDPQIAYPFSNVSSLIGTTGTAVGTGQANTTVIINQVGHTSSGAKICDELSINAGYYPVYSFVPVNKIMPYIVIGECSIISEQGTKDAYLTELEIAVEIYVSHTGNDASYVTLEAISTAALQLLRTRTIQTISGYNPIAITLKGATTDRILMDNNIIIYKQLIINLLLEEQ